MPDEWKIKTLFKKGRADDLVNYRSISILPTVSKLMERAVQLQVCRYLDEHQLLSPCDQCGFRKAHSTECAAISLSDTIRRNINQGQLTGAAFIDLRKAFDMVHHSVLLRKLYSFGITDQELKWFEDYLRNRSQVVTELSERVHR